MLTNTNKISIAIQILRQIQANWSLFLKKSGDLGGSCWPPFLVAAFALPICARNMAKDSKAAIFLCLCCICVGSLRRCQGIWLNLPATGTKCVSEDIQANVVVLADYIVVSEDHPQPPTISVKVTSPYGHDLHHTSNVTSGHFAFTTTESGSYLACFWLDGAHHSGKGAIVNLDWKVGIAARDWDSVAKKEKIEGVELDLRKLEGHVEAIHENLLYLKSREAEMRTVSETTNARVAWLSIMSLGVCIGVSSWQLWHLKRYFQKKKLI